MKKAHEDETYQRTNSNASTMFQLLSGMRHHSKRMMTRTNHLLRAIAAHLQWTWKLFANHCYRPHTVHDNHLIHTRVSEWGATEATVKHEWYVVDDSSDISTVAFPTVKAMDTQTDN